MVQESSILILGSGVSGLSTGITLLKNGYKPTIWAKDFPPNTTSNKAAAVWYPFICNPPEKVTELAKATLPVFLSDILPHPESGTKKIKVIEVFPHKKENPWWMDACPTFRRTMSKELPPGYTDGYAVEGVVMDTTIYMNYLVEMYKSLGGVHIQKEITDIKEALQTSSLVINCTGLGSRTLFNDTKIFPCRGQTVKIKPNGFDYSLFEEEGPYSLAYIIPRLTDIVLGGTAQNNDWDTNVREEDTKEIIRKVSALYPTFDWTQITGYTVGLRPSRSEIRLEAEKFGDKTVIHNYGHGGSGFTLSWGCALEVLSLIKNSSH